MAQEMWRGGKSGAGLSKNEKPSDCVSTWPKKCGDVEGGTSGSGLEMFTETEKARGGARRKSKNFEELLRKFDPDVTNSEVNMGGGGQQRGRGEPRKNAMIGMRTPN